ncbi:ZIP family metal transporter [Sphingomonas sp. HT-1]|jgi:ZIP family zinc transporter|uniref:ZIP family metal transporter n=1 Tax=unclassified Sphingomonas TaxID=196159 RepID=UPI00030EBBDE|nr:MULTISPECIES: ZIP family metal transporter [unclassified Sphingomonas]KTF69112.1 protein gufA [Sphingomonas sp. WG]
MAGQSIIMAGALGSLVAGLATGIGAIPALFLRKPSDEQQNLLLGFAAGVMLAASFFSLIMPAIRQAEARGASGVEASLIVACAVLLGAWGIARLHDLAGPLERAGLGPPGIADSAVQRRIWLFVLAITLHNFPEGMAVGVSFGGGDLEAGRATALGIGIQNIPEGLAVAIALQSAGYGRAMSALVALASGLVEPLAGLIGVSIVASAQAFLPWGLGLAAGAMIYVVASDIIPDAHRRIAGGGRASAGLMAGLAAMMFLDTAFG